MDKIELPDRIRATYLANDAGWWVGRDDEYLNIGGPFKTRNEAITCGRAEQGGDPFYICFSAVMGWTAPDAASVIEQWVENTDEIFYEDGFDGFTGANGKTDLQLEREAENDLQVILNEWMDRHKAMLPSGTTFYTPTHGEWIDKPEPLPIDGEGDGS